MMTLFRFLIRHRRQIAFGFCLLLLVALCADMAWARAGGGGGFGGGGGGGGGGFSGGGGSSGGGGGNGGLLRLLVYLCVHHPLIGYPLVLGLVIMFIYSGKEAKSRHVSHVIRAGQDKQAKRVHEEMLAAIQQHDPEFDLDQFLERSEVAFKKIQVAWANQEMADVRAFISDGIYQRFSLQLAMQKEEGFRNAMENVVVNADVAAIFSDENFDTIHVRAHASAKDYYVDLETGKPMSTPKYEQFVEYWSFFRRPGARTKQSNGAIEGNCPRCGALLDIVDRAECKSCGAHVNSGEHDWVLAEITQEREWRVPGTAGLITGVPELQQLDPGFNIQHIEDRVSVMFWMMRAAEFHEDIDYASAVLSAQYQKKFEQELEGSTFWFDPAVGKVEMIDAQVGEESGFDQVRVMVRWSGELKENTDSGQTRTRKRKAIYTHTYVLIRKHGVKSTPQETFRSAGCHQCGAPANVNAQGNCVFCGASLSTGEHDWVLDNIQPYTATLAYDVRKISENVEQAWSGSALDLSLDHELSLAVLARIMIIDGNMNSKEIAALKKLGAHRNLTEQQIEEIIREASTNSTNIPLPEGPKQTTAYLKQLIHVVLADGQITRPEKRLIQRFASRVGLSKVDVDMAIKQERKHAYQAAREELRRQRKLSV